LPAGIWMFAGIEESQDHFYQKEVTVRSDGSFSAQYGLVPDGKYRIKVLMPYMGAQPETTRAILGKHGENIKGPWRYHIDGTNEFGVERYADSTISNESISVDYLVSSRANETPDPDYPSAEQWVEWMSNKNFEQKKAIHAQILRAWSSADNEARQRGLLAKRARLSSPPVSLTELDEVEQQIEEIEERKLRELAKELGVSFHYLRAVIHKAAEEQW
jgi:hypothetical protein